MGTGVSWKRYAAFAIIIGERKSTVHRQDHDSRLYGLRTYPEAGRGVRQGGIGMRPARHPTDDGIWRTLSMQSRIV